MKLHSCLYKDWPCDLHSKNIDEFCDVCIMWIVKASTWKVIEK